MKPVIDILEDRITSAMTDVSGEADSPAIVRPATDPKFGDYQANGVMALARKLNANPRKLARDVVARLDVADICEPPEIAGAGFVNLRLKTEYLADKLLEINTDTSERLAIDKIDTPKTIVVDFSSPNIAKQMHVGHLRSTIIGDCICRLLEFAGHKVIRQNHIGDWGLQMGRVTYKINSDKCSDYADEWFDKFQRLKDFKTSEDLYKSMIEYGEQYPESDAHAQFAREAMKLLYNLYNDMNLSDFEDFYKESVQLENDSPESRETTRKWTRDLQEGKSRALVLWKIARKKTLDACFAIYEELSPEKKDGKKEKIFDKDDLKGESFYKDMLPDVVKDLKKGGHAFESDGAICVFPPGFKNKDGDDLPFIIQKSDGAYLYATTDLAALRYRVNELKADKIIYITDARQKLHFEMLFKVAQMAKWAEGVDLCHVMFGSVLGEDGKPLKTRSGENVKLKELLDEAVERAKAVVEEKNPGLSNNKKKEIAQAVGIGAIKYADYSNNRTSDYVFSFDKMLAMEGNTAPYMQYAYARIKSIERKAVAKDVDPEKELKGITKLNLTDPAEIDLAKHLIRYGEAIEAALADYRPNYLTTYLYELAAKFSAFYTNCPVLKAAGDKRPTRLLLCDLTAKTIKHGLVDLLGIEVVEQM